MCAEEESSGNLHALKGKCKIWQIGVRKSLGPGPHFFHVQNLYPTGSDVLENFGRFHRSKFKKITNKAIK